MFTHLQTQLYIHTHTHSDRGMIDWAKCEKVSFMQCYALTAHCCTRWWLWPSDRLFVGRSVYCSYVRKAYRMAMFGGFSLLHFVGCIYDCTSWQNNTNTKTHFFRLVVTGWMHFSFINIGNITTTTTNNEYSLLMHAQLCSSWFWW